jgi:hypothetical protein
MPISATEFDLGLAGRLAAFAAAHWQFSLAIESGIRRTVFGGLWFGAALFVVWVQAGRTSQGEPRLRVLSILVGTVLAILLTLAAGVLISWPPPIRLPALQELYPSAMQTNPKTNCFPSQSTAAYGAIAAGIYSLHKASGWLLWVSVIACVALPRMYVGGPLPHRCPCGSGPGTDRLCRRPMLAGSQAYLPGRAVAQ